MASVFAAATTGSSRRPQAMASLSTDVHQPPGPYRYALEVNQGWFQRHAYEAGDRVEIPDSVVELTARQ